VTDQEAPANLGPKQGQSITGAVQRVNVWEGSVRSGKTIASLLAWLLFIARDAPRNGRLVMIGRTKDTLYRNVLSVMLEMLPAGDTSITYTQGANVAYIFGRQVDIIGANDIKAEAKIRGMTVAGAYVDEATLLPGDGFWSQLLNRMSVAGARLFATTNPDGPMHWFKTQVVDRCVELGYAHWHFTLEDNPSLEPEYVDAIKKENVGLWYQRNILGLWVLAEGAIWSMWDEKQHVVDDLPPLSDCVLAADYGTAGVFAALLLGVGVDPADGRERLYVAREWRWDAKAKRRQLTDAQYSDELRRWLATEVVPTIPAAGDLERTIVDPSAKSFIAQLHRDGWERVRGADNAVADGIREVATLLAADRIRVHRSCEGLRREIPGYVWDPKKALAGEDAPVKANDHSCDAWRYGVRGTRLWWRHWITTASDVERAA
jgi:PBSX family phage terminase large subunit